MQNKFSAPFDGFLDPFLPPSVSHFVLSTSIIPNIAEMEQHHEDELRNLKANHDQLEARVTCPKATSTLLTQYLSTLKENHTLTHNQHPR